MAKKTIIILLIIAVVILIVAGAWLYFNKTNSVVVQPSNPTAEVKSSEKSIISFTFPGLNIQGNEVIDNDKHTITIIVPPGTDITSLTPAISMSDYSTISPNSGAAQDFTNPVSYTVVAQNGSTQEYTIIVEVATPQGTGGS